MARLAENRLARIGVTSSRFYLDLKATSDPNNIDDRGPPSMWVIYTALSLIDASV
jgi:hypothetical protein